MAISKTIQAVDNFNETIPFENAYIKIDSVSGGKELMSCFISAYKQSDRSKIHSYHSQFVPVLDGDNFIKQAYKHIKTLPEFVNAVDC